jgi:hypothetical protein
MRELLFAFDHFLAELFVASQGVLCVLDGFLDGGLVNRLVGGGVTRR